MTAGGRTVWFVVPESLDDPARVSGGNVYDQRVRDGLPRRGWQVRMIEMAVDAASDRPDALDAVPTGALVLVDGLVAISSPAAIEAAADRARVVVLAHMVVSVHPGDRRSVDAERRALRRARGVIATSAWTRDELTARGLVAPERVAVAVPGTDDAAAATGTATGGSLLCVGVVAPHKGQDTLVAALGGLEPGLAWTCTFAGSTAVDPAFSARVADRANRAGLADRITWAGVLSRDEIDAAYRRADLLVAPSRVEPYGMAVADALRRGMPVVASRVGGLPEAVAPGDAAVLIPPDSPVALTAALRRWITDAAHRATLTELARRGSAHRPRWTDTVDVVHSTLASLP